MKSLSARAVVSASLLTIVPVAISGASVLTASATVSTSVTRYAVTTTNVRTGPSTSYRVVSTVPAKTAFTGVLGSNGWIRITAPGAYSGDYVSAAVLSGNAPASTTTSSAPGSSTSTPTNATTVTGWVASLDHSVRVRTAPSFSASVATTLAPEAKVSGTLNGDWVKIPTGYVNAGVLEFTTSNPVAMNGKIPTSSMCPLPLAWNTPAPFDPGYTPTTTRYLNCAALNGLAQLESAYQAQFGHVAFIDLAYRSVGEQDYWYNTLGSAYAAVPGTSNHGWGLAVDFREQDTPDEFYWGHSGYQWLVANASRFGFSGDPVAYGTPHESYHWNFSG